MGYNFSKGTNGIPLKVAAKLSKIVKDSWKSGEFKKHVTMTTRDLLNYWFSDNFIAQRNINFHEGQRQAILNVIYVHEILKCKNFLEMYDSIDKELSNEISITLSKEDKYNYSKYGVKMATGTGKTFVMHALLIWQYLNAKNEKELDVSFSKNFLLVSPGLIVYERLLDAYLGKVNEKGERDFETSDIKRFNELFIPPIYINQIFGFIQNNVVMKDEIGKKITGNGMICITNWHFISEQNEEKLEADILYNTQFISKELLPLTPGTTAGHELNSLDNNYLRGSKLEFLSKLSDLVIINDEAHHIHEFKKDGEILEVKWQSSINSISNKKKENFIQIDFSATLYNISGSGQKRIKHYFPHIVVDFGLKEAIYEGLVKTIVIDKRKELALQKLEELDFNAVRDGRKVIDLSEGQKIMLQAGIKKLRILEDEFSNFDNKYPKMLVMCQDIKVSPYVKNYLINQLGLDEDDIMQIDSDKKGEVKENEWNEIKQKLFNVDKYKKPRVIISVLMLREGFDVSNICVIVPLRASDSPILLEQTIGRGLRLMWREPEYKEIKKDSRKKLLEKKKAPSNYLDILSIIEHPRFMEFYDDLIKDGIVSEENEFKTDRENILGDLIKVSLRENYKEYDLYIPIILQDEDEVLLSRKLNENDFNPYTIFTLGKLKKCINKLDDGFYSEEITVKTRFGNYKVTQEIFEAKSYNEYISKIIKAISSSIEKIGVNRRKEFPFIQISNSELVGLVDRYIRKRLFNREYNPFENENWRVLLLSNTGIIQHIIGELSKAIYQMQNKIKIEDAVVMKKYFSDVGEIKMRQNFSVSVSKSIYKRLRYPSNKGGFEKDFILFADTDDIVDSFLKIEEYKHRFIYINYIRDDGIIASYLPDFILKSSDNIYLVETKAQKDLNMDNVIRKERAALDWIQKVNKLKSNERMNSKWHFVLLGENVFYGMKSNGANLKEILDYAKLTRIKTEGSKDCLLEN